MISKTNRIAYIILGISFILRLYYVFFVQPMSSAIFSDMKNYIYVADLIADGEWYPQNFFQPIGFPYLILILKKLSQNWIFWLESIQIIASVATLWFFWQTTKEVFGEKIGLISLGIGAIHFPWIVFVGLALAESLFIFLLSLLAWISLRFYRDQKTIYAVAWGMVFFLAFLIKGTHVFFGPLFLIGLFYYKNTSFKNIVIISLVVGSGLLAHGFFTLSTIGKFQISASAGGLNFVEGKCGLKNNADSAGYSWLSPLYYQLDLHAMQKWDEPFVNSSYFMKEGMKCIVNNPLVLIQSLEGIPFLFMGNTLWPANQFKTSGWMRFYELLYALFSIGGLIVYVRFLNSSENKIEQITLWCLPVLALFLCVYIFKSEIRFRIPFDVWIIPMSLKGWMELKAARITLLQ